MYAHLRRKILRRRGLDPPEKDSQRGFPSSSALPTQNFRACANTFARHRGCQQNGRLILSGKRGTERGGRDPIGTQTDRRAICEFRDQRARAVGRKRFPAQAALERRLRAVLWAKREAFFARRDRLPAIFSKASSGLSGRVINLPSRPKRPMRALSAARKASSCSWVRPYSRQA